MEKHAVNVQRFRIASNSSEAGQAVKELGVEEVVLKAQILAGGRGKGEFSSGLKGGVRVTKEYVIDVILYIFFASSTFPPLPSLLPTPSSPLPFLPPSPPASHPFLT